MEWLWAWWILHLHCRAFFFRLGIYLERDPRDGQYHRPWQPKDHEDYWLTNGLAHRIRSNLSSWDLFVLLLCLLFLYLPIHPSSHPLIHSSIHLANPLPFRLVLLWGRSCFAELKIWRSRRFYFFFFHTSLKSSIDYTAYSCYHIYALLQASFYSHPLVSRLSETWR